MPVLIDTHILLWYACNDGKLSQNAKEMLESPLDRYLSIVSLWEISIKLNIGKLPGEVSFNEILSRVAVLQLRILPITVEHTKVYLDLPRFSEHRDPFDRMLVAQSIADQLTILSTDSKFDLYPIPRIWSANKR
ncbi:MAG: type II toxin-antitoxin system VapC family toxin [Prochlorotrichaceae cyanobacterium]|jgi:PIN domain nuclease of toxin-antitoxin system